MNVYVNANASQQQPQLYIFGYLLNVRNVRLAYRKPEILYAHIYRTIYAITSSIPFTYQSLPLRELHLYTPMSFALTFTFQKTLSTFNNDCEINVSQRYTHTSRLSYLY